MDAVIPWLFVVLTFCGFMAVAQYYDVQRCKKSRCATVCKSCRSVNRGYVRNGKRHANRYCSHCGVEID